MLQDALVRSFSKRRQFTHVNAAEAYVRRAIPSVYLDSLRKRKSRERTHDRSFERDAHGARHRRPGGRAAGARDAVAARARLRGAALLRRLHDRAGSGPAGHRGRNGQAVPRRRVGEARCKARDGFNEKLRRPTLCRFSPQGRQGADMSDLKDLLQGAGEAKRQLFASEDFAGGYGRSVVSRVKRRRVASATAMGGGTAVAVGAIAFGASNVPWGNFVMGASPVGSPSVLCTTTTPDAVAASSSSAPSKDPDLSVMEVSHGTADGRVGSCSRTMARRSAASSPTAKS